MLCWIPCNNLNESCTNVTSILKEDRTKEGIIWAANNVRQLDCVESCRLSYGVQKSISVSQHIPSPWCVATEQDNFFGSKPTWRCLKLERSRFVFQLCSLTYISLNILYNTIYYIILCIIYIMYYFYLLLSHTVLVYVYTESYNFSHIILVVSILLLYNKYLLYIKKCPPWSQALHKYLQVSHLWLCCSFLRPIEFDQGLLCNLEFGTNHWWASQWIYNWRQ